MVSESLLTDDVRATIGTAGKPVSVVVGESAVRHSQETFLGAAGEVPMPGQRLPSFVLAAIGADTERQGVPDLMPNSLFVSNEWSFERPVLMGETLIAQARIADIAERFGGRFGYGIHVRTEVEFRDRDTKLVAQSSTTLMYYDAAGGKE